ncbi:MAG TPA: HAMP domain-containing sensor histidine kinase, partial [Salinivirgaceae bacterium]|nr:HAMP domain-containing sensor histidine kinase [Salinivirgaceae bacterium]
FQGRFKSGIDLSLDLEKVPLVESDYISLSRVFVNLISNAIDAMEPQGSLNIKTRYYPDKKRVVIQFIDTGCGISSENLPKVFDPFFTTKEVGKGTGLGLYISYQTVMRYKGEIKIESEVNKGTCVSVELPVSR